MICQGHQWLYGKGKVTEELFDNPVKGEETEDKGESVGGGDCGGG